MRVSLILCCALAAAACSASPYDQRWGKSFDGGADAPAVPTAPAPTVLASGLEQPAGIVAIGDTVYAADTAAGTIVRVPIAGGAPSVVASGLGGPTWLAADGHALFAVDATGGRVLAVTTQGQVKKLATGQVAPLRVAAARGNVYWLDQGATDGSGTLMAVSETGGTPTVLAANLHTPHDLAVGAQTAFFSQIGPAPNCSAGTWSGVSGVFSVALAGGAPTSVFAPNISEVGRAYGIAIDKASGHLFVTTEDLCWPKAGEIYNVTPGGASNAISQSPPNGDRIEADSNEVTWASQELLSKVSENGGTYDNLASETNVADFALAKGSVIWTNAVTGEILSAPR